MQKKLFPKFVSIIFTSFTFLISSSCSLEQTTSLIKNKPLEFKEKEKIENTNAKPEIDDSKIFNDADDFFPKLDSKKYYELCEFKNNDPIFSQKLKTEIIKDVITRVAINKGQLFYKIYDYSENKSLFCFKWTFNEKELYKNYLIEFKKEI